MVSSTETSSVESTKYSPSPIYAYDVERHIKLTDAYEMIKNETDLESGVLTGAIESKDISIYNFDNDPYLDRLDIGRVYHVEKEKQGLIPT